MLKTHLKPDFVVGVPLVTHPVGDRVDDVYLEKVGRGGVGVVKRLLFAAENVTQRIRLRHFTK